MMLPRQPIHIHDKLLESSILLTCIMMWRWEREIKLRSGCSVKFRSTESPSHHCISYCCHKLIVMFIHSVHILSDVVLIWDNKKYGNASLRSSGASKKVGRLGNLIPFHLIVCASLISILHHPRSLLLV